MKEARRRGADQPDDQTGMCGAYRALVERTALDRREGGDLVLQRVGMSSGRGGEFPLVK